jgi:hypothetical protein
VSNQRSNRPSVMSVMLFVMASTPSFATDGEAALSLDSRELSSLKIISGAGFLHVQGVDASETIEVTGNVVGGRDSRRFTLEKHGDIAVLTAVNTERHFVFEWFGERPRIDITVKVPSRLILEIQDGPGLIAVAGMKAAARVIDDNGDMRITNHHGELRINDANGGVTVEDATGHISIVDGNGHVSLTKVVGNVDINDGNGSIVLKSIDGHVSIHDGNGGVAASNVTQGLTVNDSRSGQLAMALVSEKK